MSDPLFFPGTSEASTARLGGKGASLVRLQAAGLPVPPGAVLPPSFFAPWFAAVRAHPSWRAVEAADPQRWPEACAAVQARARALALEPRQATALDRLRAGLRGDRFAVRSSSPEEDLATASFAGGYETRLGVPVDQLEEAIRACFVSSLDARVFSYKRAHGFDPLDPSIAVIVQAQIASEVSGVAFSLNPLNNDHDEAVIDASWGLGETVVSGAVTPDHFVVDKVSEAILARELGAKQHALHLAADAGTRRQEADRSDELCLSDDQLLQLTRALVQIEALLDRPVDVEFAFAGDQLHVLQARPITAWVPVPEALRTEPGERRRLYMDVALSTGFTINVPISPMGQSWLSYFIGQAVRATIGIPPFALAPEDLLWRIEGGRMYQDLSAALWLGSPAALARGQDNTDALMADTLRAIDADTYRAARRPAWLRPWIVFAYLRAVWRLRWLLINSVFALLWPARARARLDAEVAAYEADLRATPPGLDLWQLLETKVGHIIHHAYGVTFAALGVGVGALALARWLVPQRLSELGERLGRGFEGNAVVEMGLALHEMVALLPPEHRDDPEALAGALADRALPAPFLEAWDAFVHRFGWRGPGELDLGRPRYAEDPLLALRQLCAMSDAADAFDPAEAQARHVRERREAAEAIGAEVGWLRRALLRWAHRRVELLAYARDLPKHNFLMFYGLLWPRVLEQGRALAEADRLDQPEHVFDLTLEDLEAARADRGLDLRARRRDNTRFLRLLDDTVRGFPMVIDSRGRITRPAPRPAAPGEWAGVPISPGVARGPAKVLTAPDDEPLLPGDVLVAYTTDPGWTPLFVNAAAVVLEVGGPLQHGAVVAREYGKPCVAGIPNVLDVVRNGQLVEVDGNTGILRRVDEA